MVRENSIYSKPSSMSLVSGDSANQALQTKHVTTLLLQTKVKKQMFVTVVNILNTHKTPKWIFTCGWYFSEYVS